MRKFISWRRVSTKKQGKSGLGLSAQTDLIKAYVGYENGELVADYEEVYTGKELEGCVELRKAMEHCKRIGATLIIAKTDRFRNTKEALQIYDEMNGNTYFCDCPTQDKFTLTIMFAIAEREALTISLRTKQALKAKKERDGSWSHLYGRNTGKSRETVMREAQKARVANQKEEARNNPNNKNFLQALKHWEKKNGYLGTTGNIEGFVEELNAHGNKTATGLEFTKPRALAMLKKVRELYDYYYAS